MSGSEPSTDDLLARRGELCAAAQLAALEGIVDLIDSDEALAELVAIDAALRARNVAPHGD
jgi:hypothetical protein